MIQDFARRLSTAALMIAGAAALAACGGGGESAGSSAQETAAAPSYERENDFAKGPADAPVHLIEYASVACGACANFYAQSHQTLDRLVEDGTLRYVFREMLTGQPQMATAGFMLARCAGDEQYFTMVETLLDQQAAIFAAASEPGGMRSQMQRVAAAAGLSEQRFQECLQDESLFEAVRDANQRATEDGVGATPTFFINGEEVSFERGPEGGSVVYVGGEMLEIDGEPVEASFSGDVWERIIFHFKAQAEAEE